MLAATKPPIAVFAGMVFSAAVAVTPPHTIHKIRYLLGEVTVAGSGNVEATAIATTRDSAQATRNMESFTNAASIAKPFPSTQLSISDLSAGTARSGGPRIGFDTSGVEIETGSSAPTQAYVTDPVLAALPHSDDPVNPKEVLLSQRHKITRHLATGSISTTFITPGASPRDEFLSTQLSPATPQAVPPPQVSTSTPTHNHAEASAAARSTY